MEYWLKSRISYDITPILHHSSTPRSIYACTSGNPEFTLSLFIEPYFFFVILFFRVFVIMLFVGYKISKFMLTICQPFAAAFRRHQKAIP